VFSIIFIYLLPVLMVLIAVEKAKSRAASPAAEKVVEDAMAVDVEPPVGTPSAVEEKEEEAVAAVVEPHVGTPAVAVKKAGSDADEETSSGTSSEESSGSTGSSSSESSSDDSNGNAGGDVGGGEGSDPDKLPPSSPEKSSSDESSSSGDGGELQALSGDEKAVDQGDGANMSSESAYDPYATPPSIYGETASLKAMRLAERDDKGNYEGMSTSSL
jgi:hypothetical protein